MCEREKAFSLYQNNILILIKYNLLTTDRSDNSSQIYRFFTVCLLYIIY